MDREKSLPGVQSIGIVDNVPLNESLSDVRFLPAERSGETEGGVRLALPRSRATTSRRWGSDCWRGGCSSEIGVRMALGAQASRVQRMVFGQGARVLLVGVVLGLAAAAASTRALRSLLFGVGTLDLVAFIGVAAGMVLVGLLAVYLSARRASRLDPMESLRGE